MKDGGTAEVPRKALLEVLLENRSDTFKAKVWEIVYRYGVDVDDPNLQVLIATGQLEVLLEQAPREFEEIFVRLLQNLKQYMQEQRTALDQQMQTAKQQEEVRQEAASKRIQQLNGVLEQAERSLQRQLQEAQQSAERERENDKSYLKTLRETAVQVYQQEVAKGVREVIQQAQDLKQRSWAMRVVLPVAIASLILVGLGVGVGWTLHQASMGALDPGGRRQLSLKQWELLQWAVSEEGQLSRHLGEWNQAELSDCLAGRGVTAKRMGLVSYDNRPILYGLCAMWVVPPEQRKFGNPP